MMMFPNTVEEFMEQYKIVDTEKIYTNGTELVPIFRMMQWFEHVSATDKNVGTTDARQDFMDIVYAELADDPNNNRANRIIWAADGYAERRVDDALQVIEELQSAPLGTNLTEEYAKAVRNWLVNYQVKCADLAGRYTPYEVLGWIVSDWRKENGIW